MFGIEFFQSFNDPIRQAQVVENRIVVLNNVLMANDEGQTNIGGILLVPGVGSSIDLR